MNQRIGKPGATAVPLWLARLPCGAVLLSALSAATGVATAQQHPPSGDELRSMYCIEVIRAEIDLQHHSISASDTAAASAITAAQRQQWIDTSAELLQGLAKLEALRYKLQAYMLPRIPALDPSALATAMRQGAADFQESRAVAAMDQQPAICSATCGDKTPLSRVSACASPTWLPP